MNTRRIAVVAATVLWSITLAGCGGEDAYKSQSTAAATESVNPQQAATPSTPASTPPATTPPAPAGTPEPAPAEPSAPDVIGSATVQWIAPLTKTDGSALQDLAGFKIVYGTSAHALNKVIRINNPSIDRYVVEQLPAGTYYFAVRAYDAAGAESELSNLMSKVIG